jgi:16S rRNA processing protein RimM
MNEQSNLIELGYVSGFYGVKGWVKVYSDTRPRENILAYSPWLIQLPQQGWKEVTVVDGRLQGKGVVAQLEGYSDKTEALSLLKAKIAIYTDQLPRCEEGEFYWRDLIGYSVENLKSELLGKVTGVLETGAHDVMTLSNEQGEEVLIPWVHEVFIKQIDALNKKIIVDWDVEN